ncbi:MAG: hypothetical protein U1F56_04135 [Rubrivivax sp.]
MLRALLVLLLLANALFFAWAQGWMAPALPPRSDGREPERLTQQLKPELVGVMSSTAATAAVAAAASAAASSPAPAAEGPEPPPLCLEAGPFADAAATAALATLSSHGVPDGAVQREPVGSSSTWGVVMGRFADREALRVKAEELKRLGVRYDEISFPPAVAPGLRLGNFSDKYGAEAALANLGTKGVRTARVVQLPTGTIQWWLRAPKADAELQTRLKGLPGERLATGFKPCAKAPTG